MQHLIGKPIKKVNSDGSRYLTMLINKDGQTHAIDVQRAEISDYLLEDPKYYEKIRHQVNIHPHAITTEEMADDYSYGWLTDGQLQEDFAAWVELDITENVL